MALPYLIEEKEVLKLLYRNYVICFSNIINFTSFMLGEFAKQFSLFIQS